MNKIILYGLGDFADIISCIIDRTDNYEVSGFTLDNKYIDEKEYKGLPIIGFEEIETVFSPEEYSIVIAFIGGNMYRERENKFNQAINKGYSLPNIISKNVRINSSSIGMGNIILENISVGDFCIGDGNIFWQGTILPHHNRVGNFNNFGPGSSLSGYSSIGNNCFIGNNSIIKNKVRIADYTLVGAGAYVDKNTDEYDVYVPSKSIKIDKKSFDFNI